MLHNTYFKKLTILIHDDILKNKIYDGVLRNNPRFGNTALFCQFYFTLGFSNNIYHPVFFRCRVF